MVSLHPESPRRAASWRRSTKFLVLLTGILLVAIPLLWNLKNLVVTSVRLNDLAEREDDAPKTRPKANNPEIRSITKERKRDELIQTPRETAPPEEKPRTETPSQHEKVWKTLEEVIGILQGNQVDYFLMAGSLLGFARVTVTPPWLDSDIDLAVSTTWMKIPGNVETIHRQLANSGFRLQQNYTGVDDTVASVGGALIYQKNGIGVELVATDVSPSFHVNGFRHEHYRLGCPKPHSKIETLTWGQSSLSVRVPMPYHDVLRATYGDTYDQPVSQKDYESSRMTDATTTRGRCMIVQNTHREDHPVQDRFRYGIVACLTDRESVAQAFVLAKKMSQVQPQVPLELHHLGTLSYHLQARLELYPFVTLVNLQTMATGPSYNNGASSAEAKCHVLALQTTKIRHVLWVKPSIQFLYNPHHILQTVEYVHEQNSKCQALKGASCVTSTDSELSQALLANTHFNNPKQINFNLARTYPNHSIPTLLLNSTLLAVATVHQVSDGVGLWIHPTANWSRWATADLFDTANPFVWQHSQSASVAVEYHDALQTYWDYYGEARRFLLLDRPIDWVAFDGGLFWQYSTMHSQKGANESHHWGAPIQNFDLTVSADEELIAVHNDEEFTSFPFEGNKLPARISSTNAKVIRNWTNPCIPEDTIRLWLYDNPYQSHQCIAEKVSVQDDFLIYSIDAEATYDLKAPARNAQVQQARSLAELFNSWDETLLENGQVSVRFFDVGEENQLTTAVLPDHAEKALATDRSIRQIPYYVNAPSSLACTQLVNWIHNHHSFGNKNVLGCFVVMNHEAMTNSWESLRSKHEIPLDAVKMPRRIRPGFPAAKTVCDIPRKQQSPNRTMWQTSHISCIEEGFEYIMHPWYVPMDADFARLPSGMELHSSTIRTKVFTSLIPTQVRESMNESDPIWSTYASHWGSIHQSDWHNRHDGWYEGGKARNQSTTSSEQMVTFRCVTKVLVSMLFLRLEELGYMSLDDPLSLNDSTSAESPRTTWRHVLSNSAGPGGKHAGTKFEYENDIWKHAPDFVQSVCGLNFTSAIQHYVLDPMGLMGQFDQDTPHPPYAARGFVGPMDDLLVIGSTLASSGVSPKTRRQVISAASAAKMLNNTVLGYDPTRAMFYNDPVVSHMKRFRESKPSGRGRSSVPTNVMDGYGLGLWCVKGWRHNSHGNPIRGWIALGSSESLVYFDVTGMVLAFHSPTRTIGYELTVAFANVVRKSGDLLSELALVSSDGVS